YLNLTGIRLTRRTNFETKSMASRDFAEEVARCVITFTQFSEFPEICSKKVSELIKLVEEHSGNTLHPASAVIAAVLIDYELVIEINNLEGKFGFEQIRFTTAHRPRSRKC